MSERLLSNSAASYVDYSQGHVYTGEPGTLVAASSNRTGSARLLRVHGAYGTRTVKFTASRTGAPPLIPEATDLDGDRLVSHRVSLPLPGIDPAGGQYVFSAAGEYVYLQKDMRVPGQDAFPTGRYPYPVEPQDTMGAVQVYNELTADQINTIRASPEPIEALAEELGAAQDMSTAYKWFATVFPKQTFTTLVY